MLGQYGLGIVLTASNKMSVPVNKADQDLKKLKRTAEDTGRKVVEQTDRMTAALSRYARGFTVGLKLVGLGTAMTMPFGLVTKAAMDSEWHLAQVKAALIGGGESAVEAGKKVAVLGKFVENLAKQSAISKSEISEASYELISALGFETGVAALEPASKLALASKGSISDAAKLLTSSATTFAAQMDPNLSILERMWIMSDKFATTTGIYKSELPELSAAMAYAAPSAVALGISLDEVSTIIGKLQTQGQQATMAGTNYAAFLRQIGEIARRTSGGLQDATLSMDEFIKTEEGGTLRGSAGGSRMLQGNPLLKVKFADKDGKIRPMWDIVKQIEDIFGIKQGKFQGITTMQTGYLQAMFQDEGARAVRSLLGRSEELRKEMEFVSKASGSTNTMSAVLNETSKGQWQMMLNQLMSMASHIGKLLLPVINELLMKFNAFLDKVIAFVDAHPNVAKWIAWGSALLGVFLVLVGGLTLLTFGFKTAMEAMIILGSQTGIVKLFTWLSNTIPILYLRLGLLAMWTKIVTAAQWLWNLALTANPIGLIIVGVATLIGVLVVLWNKWDDIINTISRMPKWLQFIIYFLNPILGIVEMIRVAWNWISDLIEKAYNKLKPILEWLEIIDKEPEPSYRVGGVINPYGYADYVLANAAAGLPAKADMNPAASTGFGQQFLTDYSNNRFNVTFQNASTTSLDKFMEMVKGDSLGNSARH